MRIVRKKKPPETEEEATVTIRRRWKGRKNSWKEPIYRGNIHVKTRWYESPENRIGWVRQRFRRKWEQVPCGMCAGKPTILPCPRCRDRRWMPKRGVAIFPPKEIQQPKIHRRATIKDLVNAGFFHYEGWLSSDWVTVCRIYERWLTAPTPMRRGYGEKAYWEGRLAEHGWFRRPPSREEVEEYWVRKRIEEGIIDPPKQTIRRRARRKK